ncbi:hypothetical protein QTP70_012931 [Hemibagrus guttatus]|uniref:Endonuclease/exonuclease/phosphatase domain-containing protein n=1 Tax=Hemibagrus guttatus TaxID=175788 RepID=A0AAE0UJ41_9TELE|nr:hypothetical protein QTP70_012931 [Hemibagrus guttatus]
MLRCEEWGNAPHGNPEVERHSSHEQTRSNVPEKNKNKIQTGADPEAPPAKLKGAPGVGKRCSSYRGEVQGMTKFIAAVHNSAPGPGDSRHVDKKGGSSLHRECQATSSTGKAHCGAASLAGVVEATLPEGQIKRHTSRGDVLDQDKDGGTTLGKQEGEPPARMPSEAGGLSDVIRWESGVPAGRLQHLGAGGNWATVGRRSRGGRRVHRQREKRKGKSVGLRIGTLNVGTMTGKGRELADVMERRKVDILCVQETRWKGSKARSIGAGFKLFYYGVDSKRNGVGVVLKEEFVRNVLEVKRVSDRVMSLKLEIEGVMLNVVSGYAPQVGCELEEKERFWSELDEVMESIPTGERVVIGADFNGHVGEGNTGDEEVMGNFGVKERNLEEQMVVYFAKRMDMGVVNTYFQKREEHRVTYKSGEEEVKDRDKEEENFKGKKKKKKTKWWKLKKEECCEEFRQKLRQALGGQVVLPDDWETTAEVIRETWRKVLGVSSGRR